MRSEEEGPLALQDEARRQDPQAPLVVIGCGRMGSLLASELSRSGRPVVVVDRDSRAFDLLGSDFGGFRISGDATELEVLRRAGLERASALLVTTEKDTLNLMVAQVGREIFSVPQVIARIYDPRRERLYRSFGIETISPTSLAVRSFLQQLTPTGKKGER